MPLYITDIESITTILAVIQCTFDPVSYAPVGLPQKMNGAEGEVLSASLGNISNETETFGETSTRPTDEHVENVDPEESQHVEATEQTVEPPEKSQFDQTAELTDEAVPGESLTTETAEQSEGAAPGESQNTETSDQISGEFLTAETASQSEEAVPRESQTTETAEQTEGAVPGESQTAETVEQLEGTAPGEPLTAETTEQTEGAVPGESQPAETVQLTEEVPVADPEESSENLQIYVHEPCLKHAIT